MSDDDRDINPEWPFVSVVHDDLRGLHRGILFGLSVTVGLVAVTLLGRWAAMAVWSVIS